MAIPHAKPGEIVDVRPLGDRLASSRTATLVNADNLEIIRLVVPAGKKINTHSAPGELVVQCLDGRVGFECCGATHELQPGQLLYLNAGEPHSVRGIEDGSLLLTLIGPRSSRENSVQEASEESFPASDSPSWTGTSGS